MDNNQVNLNNEPTQIPPASSYGTQYAEPPRKKTGFAITALVLGIISIIGVCCCINIITAPIAIIFGIISLAAKRGGTGMSIVGIILSVLSLIIIFSVVYSAKDFYPYADTMLQDYTRLVQEQDTVFPAYEEDGTLPDYIQKYAQPPYSDLLQKYDITIYDVMDALLAQYKKGGLAANGVQVNTAPVSSMPDNTITALPPLLPAFS